MLKYVQYKFLIKDVDILKYLFIKIILLSITYLRHNSMFDKLYNILYICVNKC